jgi:hypothetical protein
MGKYVVRISELTGIIIWNADVRAVVCCSNVLQCTCEPLLIIIINMNRWRNDFLSFSRPSSQTYNEESRVEKLRRDKKKK